MMTSFIVKFLGVSSCLSHDRAACLTCCDFVTTPQYDPIENIYSPIENPYLRLALQTVKQGLSVIEFDGLPVKTSLSRFCLTLYSQYGVKYIRVKYLFHLAFCEIYTTRSLRFFVTAAYVHRVECLRMSLLFFLQASHELHEMNRPGTGHISLHGTSNTSKFLIDNSLIDV
jgi:hypothetical protein